MSGRGDGVISRDQEGALLCLRTEKGCAPLFRFDAYAGMSNYFGCQIDSPEEMVFLDANPWGQIKMIVMQGVPAVWINFLASLNKVEGISIQNLG